MSEEKLTVKTLGKDYLYYSDMIIVMLSDGTFRCYSTSNLQPKLFYSSKILADSQNPITSFSTFVMSDENEYLIVAYKLKGVLRIYRVDSMNDQLVKVYEVKHATD